MASVEILPPVLAPDLAPGVQLWGIRAIIATRTIIATPVRGHGVIVTAAGIGLGVGLGVLLRLGLGVWLCVLLLWIGLWIGLGALPTPVHAR